MTGGSRAPAPAPPWRIVLANTLRLWWQRRVSPPGPEGHSRRRIQALRVIVSLLVISLVVVSATAIHLAQTQASAPGHQGRADRTSTVQHTAAAPTATDTEALRAATQTRQRAAGWVADQVGRSVIVACDPLMCTALQRHGFPAANLTPVVPGTGDPLGSGVVVSTQAVRDALGSRLTTVYAPLVIASFGAGQSLVQVLATAPDGAAAYQTAERADLQARRLAGRQLLRNKNLHLSKAAAADLASGQVDARLLITLAALARQPVSVLSFGGAGPGAAAGVPLLAMEIRSTSPRYLQGLLAFLAGQRAPLLAAAGVSHAGKITIVHVKFTAPSPTGLLAKT